MFSRIWFKRSLSVMISSCLISCVSTYKSSCLALMLPSMMVRRSCSTSGRCTVALSSLMVPLSMRLISKTSLIRLSRCCPDTLIFCRYSLTSSGLFRWVVASAVKPRMAFIGVRISCDILFKNTVFALLACSAAASALRRASSCFCSVCFSMVASREATSTAVTLPSSSVRWGISSVVAHRSLTVRAVNASDLCDFRRV